MDNQGSVTLYRYTKASENGVVEGTRQDFNNLGILSINMGQARKQSLMDLFTTDIILLNFAKNLGTVHGSTLEQAFHGLKDWIKRWRDAESANAGSNSRMLEEFQQRIDDLKITILAILLLKKGGDYGVTKDRAKRLYESRLHPTIESMLAFGKKDNFRTDVWAGGETREWGHFINSLNDEVFLFFSEGISPIYVSELKTQIRIGDKVNYSNLDAIFSYMWGSFNNFRRFINRNFLFGLIEKGLQKNGLSYEEIQRSVNVECPPIIIKLTRCPFPNLNLTEYHVGNSGIVNSARGVQDHLIIFGKDSPDECTCDISFPNMKQLDSIFAFIYSASRGYYLVNISTNEVVKVKLNPEDPLELEDKMVIIFGNGHSFTIEIQDGLRSGNNILKQIKVMEIKNAKQR